MPIGTIEDLKGGRKPWRKQYFEWECVLASLNTHAKLGNFKDFGVSLSIIGVMNWTLSVSFLPMNILSAFDSKEELIIRTVSFAIYVNGSLHKFTTVVDPFAECDIDNDCDILIFWGIRWPHLKLI